MQYEIYLIFWNTRYKRFFFGKCIRVDKTNILMLTFVISFSIKKIYENINHFQIPTEHFSTANTLNTYIYAYITKVKLLKSICEL